MTTHVWRIGFLALALSLATVASAHAEGGHGGRHMGGRHGFGDGMMGDGPGMIVPLILRHADLTPEQDAQVRQIMQSNRQQLHALFDQLHAANDGLVDKLLASGTVQPQDLAPQMQRISQLRQQLMDQGLKSALAIRAVLTPQQLTKVAQLKEKMQKLHSELRDLMGTE